MKKSVILSFFCFLTINVLASQPAVIPILELTHTPEVAIGKDSVYTYLYMSIPGVLGKSQVYHQYNIYMVSTEDAAVRELITTLKLIGNGRERYIRRQLRREGKEPEPVQWSRKFKTRRNRNEQLGIKITSPRQQWMEEGCVIVIVQEHSRYRNKPAVVLPEEMYTPFIYYTDAE